MPKVKKPKLHKYKECVPYAKGFKPPSKTRQVNAIGLDGSIPCELNPASDPSGYEFFKSIPQPTNVNDWLAQYNEEGQTYKQFLSECPWLSTRKRKGSKQNFIPNGKNILERYPNGKIYIAPVGKIDGEISYFGELAKFAEIYLGIPVCILPQIEVNVIIKDKKIYWTEDPGKDGQYGASRRSTRPKQHTLESRFHKNRYQIGVPDLLHMLRQKLPDDAVCFIGLTMSDLFCDNTDLFVAGMAAGNHHVAIFSFHRYNPALSFSDADWYDIYKDITQEEDTIQRTMFHRSCKLLVHEINHLLGIDHCIFYDCCMNGSGHLTEDFCQPMHLCPVDLHKLQTLVGFNVVERYKSLLQFYNKHEMTKEKEWVEKRLNFIKS